MALSSQKSSAFLEENAQRSQFAVQKEFLSYQFLTHHTPLQALQLATHMITYANASQRSKVGRTFVFEFSRGHNASGGETANCSKSMQATSSSKGSSQLNVQSCLFLFASVTEYGQTNSRVQQLKQKSDPQSTVFDKMSLGVLVVALNIF